ncbi:hypothetical protein B0H17DRAFT_1138345 [Mycena rosella]|uniref:Uncharacterized protein n=1 Tax=Mycena rosella TaxID=1033263 RepID=A0AAD7D6J4_MYCRO|nr:hypothetical protein B0H17DRAFT_1138345 [Mycena rosella]
MDVRAKVKTPIQSSSSRSLAPALSSTPSITPAASWEGWPDGHLQYLFSPQGIAGTNQLEMDWVCGLLPGHRGSLSASVWQKGKEICRQCVGILECSSRICSAKRQIAYCTRSTTGYTMSRDNIPASPASNSQNWCSVPPHISNSAATSQFLSTRSQVGDNPPAGSGAQTTASTGETQGTADQDGESSPISLGSPTPGTLSPTAPTGLTARVMMDNDGTHYLIQVDTGLRIDVVDGTLISTTEEMAACALADRPATSDGLGPSLSKESGLLGTNDTEADGQAPLTACNPDSKLSEFIQEIGEDMLTQDQMAMLNQVRGVLSTSCD